MSLIDAISPLDGRYAPKLNNLKSIVSEYGLIKYRIKVELEWFKLMFSIKEFNLPQLSTQQTQFIDAIYTNFDLTQAQMVKDIEKTTNHDVKAVEYYIKNKLKDNSGLNKYLENVHFCCTSEDINNLSYALMLKELKQDYLLVEVEKLNSKIQHLAYNFKNIAMISRTHGQVATPTTMGKELYNVYYRINRQLTMLKQQELLGKFNGAVGNFNAHVVSYPNIDWVNVSKTLIESKLNLTYNPFTTQIEPHDYIAELLDIIKRINVILIDFNRDIWGYISLGYFKQKIKAGEIGSSTMPHKVNPIDFENSEGNLGLSNSLAIHLSEKLPVSRFQRDLTDSTVLRNIGSVIGYTLLSYSSLLNGLNKLEINQEAIDYDLDNSWELLAEPIQTVMRKYNIANAYELLKELSRGKKLNQETVANFIRQLAIPEDEKDNLLKLEPRNYIGLADKLF
jgi:adenylosuccinate lyase